MMVLERLADRPGRVVLCLSLGQAVLWTLAPALAHSAPPLDVVESLVWGREGVVATFKHPNLPGLVLHAARWLASGALWPCYLVSQLCIVASFAAVYLLGRDLFGPARALAGTLLLTGIFYFSWPSPEMNHNVAQMPLWAGVCLALWRSVHGGRLVWWIALGALAGLALWAKYSAGVLLAAALGWMLAAAPGRACFRTAGPWAALAAFALVVLPQARFLVESGWLPIDYAISRAHGEGAGAAPGFLAAQIADHAVFLVMAAIAGLFGAGASRRPPEEAAARRFLLALGLGPVLLIVALSAAGGVGLKDMWGAPMFNLSGLLLIAYLPGRLDARALGRLIGQAAALLVLVPAAYAAQFVFAPALAEVPLRAAWPQDAIAGALLRAYENETGRPPRIVAGPVWEAGLVALAAPGAPSVLIDGAGWKSPWIAGDAVARDGALVVWPAGSAPTESLKALVGDRPVGRMTFRWAESATARPIEIAYAVIPPGDRGRRHTGAEGD